MILQMNIPDDEARMFEVSARKRSMTVEEWLMYCAFKQLSQEYSFIVADADDLEKNLSRAWKMSEMEILRLQTKYLPAFALHSQMNNKPLSS